MAEPISKPAPSLPPQVLPRINKELKKCRDEIPYFQYDSDGVHGEINTFYVGFIGVGNYENQWHIIKGKFMNAGGDRVFPMCAPLMYFVTPIFHNNVSVSGSICLDTLNSAWTSFMGIGNVVQSIYCLLDNPEPGRHMNPAVCASKNVKAAAKADYEKRIKLVPEGLMTYVFGADWTKKTDDNAVVNVSAEVNVVANVDDDLTNEVSAAAAAKKALFDNDIQKIINTNKAKRGTDSGCNAASDNVVTTTFPDRNNLQQQVNELTTDIDTMRLDAEELDDADDDDE